jgi:hypothetical protein
VYSSNGSGQFLVWDVEAGTCLQEHLVGHNLNNVFTPAALLDFAIHPLGQEAYVVDDWGGLTVIGSRPSPEYTPREQFYAFEAGHLIL